MKDTYHIVSRQRDKQTDTEREREFHSLRHNKSNNQEGYICTERKSGAELLSLQTFLINQKKTMNWYVKQIQFYFRIKIRKENKVFFSSLNNKTKKATKASFIQYATNRMKKKHKAG